MKKFVFVMFSLCCLVGKLYAHPKNFDIFGVDEKTKQHINLACSDLMSEHLKFVTDLYASSKKPTEQDRLKQLKLEEKIINKAKQFGHFSHAMVSIVYYPVDKETFATLDLVKTNDKHRIPRKTRIKSKKASQLTKEVRDLFSTWNAYVDKKIDLIQQNQFEFGKGKCPVPHCIWGFDDQELKDTLPLLQQGVSKHKSELFEIIRHSSDEHQREDAIFILGHDTNYQALVNFLINFTDDANDVVRNNVMRVLGAIATKYQIKQLDIHRIITALNFPYVTDRNKAAYVLYGIVKSNPTTHQQVINLAGGTLLELLKLQQPNNHDIAYRILKEISKQSYDDTDYHGWETWIRAHRSSTSLS